MRSVLSSYSFFVVSVPVYISLFLAHLTPPTCCSLSIRQNWHTHDIVRPWYCRRDSKPLRRIWDSSAGTFRCDSSCSTYHDTLSTLDNTSIDCYARCQTYGALSNAAISLSVCLSVKNSALYVYYRTKIGNPMLKVELYWWSAAWPYGHRKCHSLLKLFMSEFTHFCPRNVTLEYEFINNFWANNFTDLFSGSYMTPFPAVCRWNTVLIGRHHTLTS